MNPLKILALVLSMTVFQFIVPKALAIYDPASVPNNRFGIHLISPTPDESSPAASLVNSSGGDWGYVTIIIPQSDRDHSKWQLFFNDLRRRHLIPIVRIATEPQSDYWTRPDASQAQAWADFLDSLDWPTQNRYVVIYNEPNHAKEWGDSVDPVSYAHALDQTITALKTKSDDFFVLNAGLDASAPDQPPNYMDSFSFMRQMNQAVPGIFNRLDGFASHSYPNPNFSGSPTATGKGTVGTWKAELELLGQLGVTKSLPVFITETGWKHSGNGSTVRLLTPDTVADYYYRAFEESWQDPRIVAITPFILTYQTEPFKDFSFKKTPANNSVLGITSTVHGAELPQYQPQYYTLTNLTKTPGVPLQNNSAKLSEGQIYPSIVSGEEYILHLTFTNTGQSIWNDNTQISLRVLSNQNNLDINVVAQSNHPKVEPDQSITFYLKLKAPQDGTYNVSLNLFADEQQFSNQPFSFTTQVKSPISLVTKASLAWKHDPAGQYVLKIANGIQSTVKQIFLDSSGQSQAIEDRQLLPDQEYTFTLTKDHYYPKTVTTTLKSGSNTLDFGSLTPDIPSAILKPSELWKLLPFTN